MAELPRNVVGLWRRPDQQIGIGQVGKVTCQDPVVRLEGIFEERPWQSCTTPVIGPAFAAARTTPPA